MNRSDRRLDSSCANYIFSTNHADAFALDEHDRRFFVHEVTRRHDGYRYDEFVDWMENGGPGHLHAYLLDVDLADFDLKRTRPPMTQAKAKMVNLVRSDLGEWVAGLLTDPDEVLPPRFHGRALFTSGELLELYDPHGTTRATANGLAREVNRQGARQTGQRGVTLTKLGSRRLWAIRNQEHWVQASHAARAAHYEQFVCQRF